MHLGQLGGHRDHEHAAVEETSLGLAYAPRAISAPPSPPRTAGAGDCRPSPAKAGRRPRTAQAIASPERRSQTVVDVAAPLLVQPLRAFAAQALNRAVLVPAGRQALEPSKVGTSTTAPWRASGMVQRHLDLEVVAVALEHRGLRHPGDHVQVTGVRAAQPGLALAGQPDTAALVHPRRERLATAGGHLDRLRIAVLNW